MSEKNYAELTPQDKAEMFKEKISSEFVTEIDPKAIVTVPFSGDFKLALDDLYMFLLSQLTTEEIIKTMVKIRNNFENVEPKDITGLDKAIWTVMSIQSELSFQAIAQNKIITTDKKLEDNIKKIFDENMGDLNGSAEEINKAAEEYNKFNNTGTNEG